MTSVSVVEHLQAALGYLEEYGWTQGAYCRGDGSVCAAGALYKSGNVLELDNSLKARGALQKQIPDKVVLEVWNDSSTTTAEDVKLAFKKAIEYAEENHL